MLVAINLNPYQGLKHQGEIAGAQQPCCNQPKSLSGIETFHRASTPVQENLVAINLNPYQGLKRLITKLFPGISVLQST